MIICFFEETIIEFDHVMKKNYLRNMKIVFLFENI